MIKILKTIGTDLLNLLLPAICISCNQSLRDGRLIICEKCYNSLPQISPKQTNAFINRLAQRDFNKIYIMFEFSELFQNLMHLFKYDGHQVIATYFAAMIKKKLNMDYDIIAFVPLHKTKQRERGFNQSEVIAYFLCKLSDLTFSRSILIRDKYTQSQTKLNRAQRKENMRDVFKVVENVENKTILLIDDVITTGATVNECARVLKGAKCKRVDIAAMATPVNILQSKLEIDGS
jgi:ComF family protein